MGLMGLMGLICLMGAEPNVRALDVRGLQAGATTALTVDGEGLEGARLLLPFAAKATARPGATKNRVVFDVALGDVPAQSCNLRVVADGGVSAPVAIAVDGLPQKPFAAEAALPVALHGTLNGSSVLSTKFAGKAGEKVM
ncbi:MAG: hypothetical protein K2W96_25970, partial [Gemmataceae bacterium]|nr:hypothetical protein [Gemmataceae bacterium]